MPDALPTRAELQHQLDLARATVILAEDAKDWHAAEQARKLCDDLLDLLNEHAYSVDV